MGGTTMSARQEDAIRNFCQQKGITEEELGRKISEGIQKYMPPFPIDSYKKGYKDAVDKACKIIDTYLVIVRKDIAYTNKEFIKDFKEAMEEQQ